MSDPKSSALTRLTPELIAQLTREVFATSNRRDLDRITKRIWREFDGPGNAEALERLKTVILARRQHLGSEPQR